MAESYPYRDQLREALRGQREAMGITPVEAAKLCGVSKAYYAAAEGGDTGSLEKLISMAHALGLDVILCVRRHGVVDE